jgi:DNA-binding response OmpR family regulator
MPNDPLNEETIESEELPIHVLLVEDEPDLRNTLRYNLKRGGYSVTEAQNGQEALEKLTASETTNPVEILVSDVMMPGMDGHALAKAVRANPATAELPLMFLTAKGDPGDRLAGFRVGADDYLTKPFGMRELIARVHALLRRIEHVQSVLDADRAAAPQPVMHDGLVLEPAGYVATLEGAPLDLTRTEFDLLVLLLRNPGRAFSRSYLLDTVWGADYITGDRSVDNAVLRLRKKLGALGDALETVWGVGYRWRR